MTIGRRTFLGKLLASPLAAAGATEAAGHVGMGGMGSACEPMGHPDPTYRGHDRLADSLHHAIRRTSSEDRMNVKYIPAFITTKKSWSPVFMEHVYRQAQREAESLHRQVSDALHNSPDPVTRGYRLMKIAKRLGVDA